MVQVAPPSVVRYTVPLRLARTKLLPAAPLRPIARRTQSAAAPAGAPPASLVQAAPPSVVL